MKARAWALTAGLGVALVAGVAGAGSAAHAVAGWVKPTPPARVVVYGRAAAWAPGYALQFSLRVTNNSDAPITLAEGDFSLRLPGVAEGAAAFGPFASFTGAQGVTVTVAPHRSAIVKVVFAAWYTWKHWHVHYAIDGQRGSVTPKMQKDNHFGP